MPTPGWRRWLAGILLALGGLIALGDLAAPDDPLGEFERQLAAACRTTRLDPARVLSNLRAQPLYAQASRESAWRSEVRHQHRNRESLRTAAVSLGALALAWGILSRRRWAAPLLAAGLALWTALYAQDLVEGFRFLGALPALFAWGQGLNLLFLAGLWLWLRRDDGQPRRTGLPSAGDARVP